MDKKGDICKQKDPNIKKERKKYNLEESLSHADIAHYLSFPLCVIFFFFVVGQARKVNYGQSR